MLTPRTHSNCFVALCVTLSTALSGCAAPALQADKNKLIPGQTPCPIHRVVCFFNPPIFKSFDAEGDPNPEGFACTLYLVSRETGKGVHVDGTLHAKMYRVDRGPDGEVSRHLVCDWSEPTGDLPRNKKASALGWGYVPQFYWGEQDVLGSEIEIVLEYESPYGHKVRSQTHHFQVPARKL